MNEENDSLIALTEQDIKQWVISLAGRFFWFEGDSSIASRCLCRFTALCVIGSFIYIAIGSYCCLYVCLLRQR